MNILLPFVTAFAALWLVYRFYVRFIDRRMGEDNARPTPASVKFDNKDFIPLKRMFSLPIIFRLLPGPAR